jgi:energy-coupling factor transport system permease protein
MPPSLGYAPRQSILEKFDPRALVIFYLGFVVVAMFVQDVRLLVGMVFVAVVLAVLSKLSLAQTRRSWISFGILITFFTVINLIIGRGWLFAATQALRLFALFLSTLAIMHSINPADFGIAFRQLGAPDKLAFAISLMLRFVPTLARDFQITIDAQRARGFELDAGKGKLWERAKRYGPMLVPVIVRSVLDSEDIANAMDLRGFASRRRTWLRTLVYRSWDYVLISLGALLVIGWAVLAWQGLDQVWTP